MRIVRLPWAIATVLMRTFSPMTMTPVCSSITTLATVSGVTRSRSAEHTSELQSLMRISYAVFCLKKPNQYTNDNDKYTNTETVNPLEQTPTYPRTTLLFDL